MPYYQDPNARPPFTGYQPDPYGMTRVPMQPSPGYYTNQIPYMQNQQPPMPNAQQNASMNITGRVVRQIDEVAPNEVPMDGSVSFFPQSDLSCVYAKQWTKKGTIATTRYVLEQTSISNGDTPKESNDLYAAIMSRLDKIEGIVASIKPYNRYQKRRYIPPENGSKNTHNNSNGMEVNDNE